MGKIAAHKKVTLQVIEALRGLRPQEDYPYLELGNFLTDIEQVRDPTAMIAARSVVVAQAKDAGLFGNIPILGGVTGAALAGWAPDLLGRAEPRRQDGALSRFAVHLARFCVHEFFSAEGKASEFKLDPDDLDRVLDGHFGPRRTGATGSQPREGQYYPHAHLDLPPFLEGPRHQEHPLYQRKSSGLIGYLEEQIQALSEDLSKIEEAFVRLRDRPVAERRPLLVRLGRALHGIEDFFFHSNFAELFHYYQLRRRNNRGDGEDDRDFLLVEAAGRLLGEQRTPHRLRRRFARRLLYPLFEPRRFIGVALASFRGSTTNSIDARTLVYTGGFGSEDVNHSVVSSLPDTLPEGQALLLQQLFSAVKLELFSVVFDKNKRRNLARDPALVAESRRLHEQQLLAGQYHKAIDKGARDGLLTRAGARELTAAFDEDLAIEKKYRFTPGVGGFLISFLAAAEGKVMQSEVAADRLESGIASNANTQITARATDNGAGSEFVGTHTLLAKDDPAAAPFHDEASTLAAYVSTSVASLLIGRVVSDNDPNRGLDWDSILRVFLRFPHIAEGTWERRALDGQVPRPALDAPFRMLGPDFQPQKLRERRSGTKASELEQRYQELEVRKSQEQGGER